MKAIFRREIKAYFNAMPAYVYLAISLILCGVMFFITNIMAQSAQMTSYFSNIISWSLFFLPLLTMRMFSEDKKQKTDVLLLTAPVSVGEMVMGKFLSAYAVFLTGTAITLLYPVIIAIYGTLPVAEVVCGYIGYMLVCGMIIAIGALMSAVTDNQIVAAVSTFGVILVAIFLGNVAGSIPVEAVAGALVWLSPLERFTKFSNGVLSVPGIVYYLSVTALFLFLTCCVFEKRRFR